MTKSEALQIISNPQIPFTHVNCPHSSRASAKFSHPSDLTGYQWEPCIGCNRPDLPSETVLAVTVGLGRLVPRGPDKLIMTSCRPLT
jgi:hypothetical protein